MNPTLQNASARSFPRLALTAAEAAESIGVSSDFFAEHVAGDLKFVRRGRKKLVAVRELEQWLDENATRLLNDLAGPTRSGGSE